VFRQANDFPCKYKQYNSKLLGWEGASHAAVFGLAGCLAGCLSQKPEKVRKRAPGTKWVYDFPPPTVAAFVLSVCYSTVKWGEFSERQQILKRITGLCI